MRSNFKVVPANSQQASELNVFFSHACSQTMAEERISKILFDSDSEEEFLRFTDEDIVQPRREIIADSDSLDEAPVLVR